MFNTYNESNDIFTLQDFILSFIEIVDSANIFGTTT